MRWVVLSIWLVAVCPGHAQWENVGGGVMWGNVQDVLYDEESDRLYVAGDMSTMYQDSLQVHGITYWKDGLWHPVGTGVTDTSGGLVRPIRTIVMYDSALVAVGEFDKMGEAPGTAHCAQFRNGAWAALGIDTPVHSLPTGLYVIEDTLHMLGWFDTVGTQVIHKWAKWDGQQWSPGGANEPIINQTQACARYQGDYYVGGNFYTQNGINDVARWAEGAWHALGPGLLGDPWVWDLMVYNDLLWVAGNFYSNAGNAASGLMAWNGANWLNMFPQIHFISQCRDLTIINGQLFFSGPFLVQGLTGEFRIGKFDGQTLCILGGPGVVAGRITGSQDTLYASTCNYSSCVIQGVEMHGVMKWPLDAPADTCFEIVQSVADSFSARQIELYPNPARDEIHIILSGVLQLQVRSARIMDMLGKEVRSLSIGPNGRASLNLSGFGSGLYSVRFVDQDAHTVAMERFVHLE